MSFLRMILSFFTGLTAEATPDFRRRHVRHTGVTGDIALGQSNYSLRDWSLGGASFDLGPDAAVMRGDQLMLEMTFRLPTETITVTLPAKVVRTARGAAAVEFADLETEARRQLARVTDGLNAQEFLSSQQQQQQQQRGAA